ncbi:MAG: AbrB/MazE/SpoVT family DNA-binding domain-containing protein [Candidatus Saccharibacteria bacterium]|nr:AbrB/MazE/SpoVT family DNA-binding domain-containing protein [Candidatus Saccharibacteria bacterium]
MVTAKVFQSGNSQAIRIPNEFHTTQKEFCIRKFGEGIFLIPVDDPWMLIRNSLGGASGESDFERNQPLLSDIPNREEL